MGLGGAVDQPRPACQQLDQRQFRVMRQPAELGLGQRAVFGVDIGYFGGCIAQPRADTRSEQRRVGEAWVSTYRSRWSPRHQKKNNDTYYEEQCNAQLVKHVQTNFKQ